jgi:uncharacterized membrane protein YesL
MGRGVRIFFRGLSDTLEHLLAFVLYSIAWWVCCFTIVFGPGALVALFAATDPRTSSAIDGLGVREFFGEARRRFGSGWKLALVTLPFLAILIHNLWFYQDTESDLGFLAPAWFILLFFGSLIAMTSFSVMALFNESWKSSLRIGAILTGARLFQALAAGFFLWILLLIGVYLVVPFFILLPATIAATFNRLTLNALNIPINDPLAPTEERRAEEASGKKRRWFGP